MPGAADLLVKVVGENPDANVKIIGGQVVESTPADAGKVLYVGPDGVFELRNPGTLADAPFISWDTDPDTGITTPTIAGSSDASLGGGAASDLLLPTQAAVKSYVDFTVALALLAARGYASGETTADVAVNNSTTLVNANPSSGPGLSLASLPVGNYWVYSLIPYWATSNAHLKLDFTMSSGAGTFLWSGRSLNGSSVSGGAQNIQNRRRIISENESFGGQGSPAVATDDLMANPMGRLKVTSTGTLQLRFAQNAAQLNDCTIMAGAQLFAAPVVA